MKGKSLQKGYVTMEKRRKVVAFSFLITTLAVNACYLIGLTQGKKKEVKAIGGDLVVSALEGIRIQSIKSGTNQNGDIIKVISYSFTPEDTPDTQLNTLLYFNPKVVESYDWTEGIDVANEKPEDYMGYELDASEKTITFTCHKPFGRTLLFQLISADNPNVTASVSLDYERKIIEDAKASLNVTKFTDKEPVKVSYTSAVYSIGTMGRRSDEMRWEKQFVAQIGYSFKELFGAPKNPSSYKPYSFYYQGTMYDEDGLLTLLSNKVETYLSSCITEEGNVIFQEAEFKKMFAYQYFMYRTYKDEYGTTYELYEKFLNNYQKAIDNNGGFKVTVYANDTPIYDQLLPLGIKLNGVKQIHISSEDSHLVF